MFNKMFDFVILLVYDSYIGQAITQSQITGDNHDTSINQKLASNN